MAKTVTLDKLITDLMDIIRGSEVARTEPISQIQVEDWIHQYRSVLIKRELDKGRLINPGYIQTMDLPVVAEGDVYRTSRDIPKTVYKNDEPGFTWIGNGTDEYQFTTSQRFEWSKYKKWAYQEGHAYLENDRLYTNRDEEITIKGLFENPMDVIRLNDPNKGTDAEYPLPLSMVPTIREMILKKELGIEAEAPSDETNDDKHSV